MVETTRTWLAELDRRIAELSMLANAIEQGRLV
jgi:hypothetical protein